MEKLGEYCKIISGYAFKSTDLSEGTEIPVIKIGNISNGKDVVLDNSTQYVSKEFLAIDEKYHVRKGDVLISLTGSHINQPNSMVGRSCRNYSDTEFLLNQRAGKIIPKDNSDKNYLYYLLNTESFKYSICNRAYGAANQANVSPSDIENIKWDFPPLPTQQKIASILSAYDNLIQNYKKQIEDLQTTASELYKEWFVRFRFPGYKTAQFENGIPVGWKVKKFIDEFNILYGKGLATDELVDEGYPVFGSNGLIGFYSSYMYEQPQVLISCRGASSGVVNISLPKSFITSNSLICELDKRTESNFEYLSFALKAYKLTQYQTGSAQPQITIDNIKKLKLIIPSKDLVVTFKGIINPINEKILYLQQQITNLTQQRDLLLPRLMSGKLEVK